MDGASIGPGARISGSAILPGAVIEARRVDRAVDRRSRCHGRVRRPARRAHRRGRGRRPVEPGTSVARRPHPRGGLMAPSSPAAPASSAARSSIDCSRAGHEVDVVDNLSTGNSANLAGAGASAGDRLTFHHLDIREPTIVELITDADPRSCSTSPPRPTSACRWPGRCSTPRSTSSAACRCSKGARRAGTRKVVVASSGGTIYGEPRPADLPVNESHPQHPVSPYGVAKKVVGDYLFAYRGCTGSTSRRWRWPTSTGPARTPRRGGRGGDLRRQLLARRAVHGLRRRRADPRLRLCRRRRRRVRAGRRQGLGLLFNIGTGVETSVNELYASMAGAAGVTAAATRRTGRAGELARSALDPSLAGRGWAGGHSTASTSALAGRARLVPQRRASAEEVLGRVAHDRRAARCRRRSHSGSTPRTTATGTPVALPITSSAAPAISSTTATSVTCSSRPKVSVGAPQVEDGADAGAADGHVGDAAPPRAPERVATRSPRPRRRRGRGVPSRMRRAERSESSGSNAA